MPRDNFADLLAFIAVARERSFTRAAARLGVSQSALSHTIRSLETRLGVRLLARTTRSVSPTEAGERLLLNLAPRFDEIEAELSALAELRDKPAGTVRINATDYAIRTLLWPKLSPMLRDYRDLKVEFVTDYGLSDIVAERFDIGVRLGDQVAKDMIAVRISPDLKMTIVGAPAYFAQRERPMTPQDLVAHDCINLRLPTHGALYAWELARGDDTLQVRVDGQVTFDGTYEMLDAALAGYGLAYVPAELAAPHVDAGCLVSVLDDWCPTFPGHHLYYASRRQSSRALALIVDTLRHPAHS
ncbi:LysR family transcriptional regulator [Burkholderia sp. Bp9017]|uniref:LysR family transcriptional regulator n=1 Tax=Burkholderia anthina TaxID=179879 RepID=A0A7T7AK88_9BURK|nr:MULTISPECIES: LysR family transcriptional regulator [Burkholderia]MBY4867885.1 LysR family transcriptional regulator [Burkholderia anthina]QQK05442.1 LysR family transcriptional regulator [Burkholderia anthina]RQZ27679.1 LysR family transcriptional regulator [Burkholderia sp. Bp9017]RQZ35509.1 LysR family transcriptional regulator [Burkholderia sp. Bp9016]